MSEVPVEGLISVAEAIRIIDAASVTPRLESVALAASLSRRLARPIIADRDDPPFDKSQMDGYAVRSGDGLTLQIVGDIPAGGFATRALQASEAMSIMTGAPVPPDADAVVPVEKTRREGDVVHLQSLAKAGQSIARRGSDCVAGQTLLTTGQLLNPPQIAVAAGAGLTSLDVFARARVGVLGTGDEIVPVDRTPQPHQIRNTNSPMLLALLDRLGCEGVDLGIVRDEPALIRQRLEEGVAAHDVLLVTGGMSMGTYDYVPRLLIELGFELRISKLKIKPGKPFVFAVRGNQFVFGLPGNPVSGFVCTLRLASRLIARLAGGKPSENWTMGKLAVGLPANGPREFYQPATIEHSGHLEKSAQARFPLIRPLAWKASSDIYTLASADALIIRAENEPTIPVGTVVSVLRLP